jgi:DNA polymerase-3 subunit gamma/tau
MTHTSLHTKYRPTSLDQVVGQPAVVAGLKRVLKDGRAKAFIFAGPPGTGKTTLARIMANEFCNGKANSTNIVEIDGASHSGADAMRDVVSRAHFRPVGASGAKSIIVDEAHRLSSAAFTILLKPMEEPTSSTQWMLCTTDVGKIPKAIQTRCIIYNLKPVDELVIYDLVADVAQKEGMNIDPDILEAVAEGSNGSPRQSLVNLEAVAHCASVAEATRVLLVSGQDKEAIDLCRFMVVPGNKSWPQALGILKGLDGADPEGVRLTVVNYISKVLLNTSSEKKALYLLSILEAFSKPYHPSEKMAPLLLSVGMALGLDS